MEVAAKKKRDVKKKSERRMSLEKFLQWSGQQEDAYKYEWTNGMVEKTKKMTTYEQAYIIDNLLRAFNKTKAYEVGGQILTELDCYLPDKKVRRPDLAFVSAEQLRSMKQGEFSLPAFMIEIISSYDQINRVKNKLQEYFDAGVKVVWHIFPSQKQVEVYTSPKEVKICTGEDVCSAAPVIADFELSVNTMFH